uniref:Polymeric immunoglobulin receptor n=1 Tax=Scophthalmus maximus TaxID=52904 RepID=A0A8D3AWY4_SCOMX
MPQLLILTLGLLPGFQAFLCGVTAAAEFEVLEGRPLTVPCHYEPQYASYVKYWCQGRMREFCTSLARTDEPHSTIPGEDKVRIYDDPVQLVFTVTMNDLKEDDSGWYICGVEIGGLWSADVVAYTDIEVIHGMSVVNDRLSGEEGSSVAVDCHYSKRYRESQKKWCRSGDWSSCLPTDSDGSYEDTSVAISDDRTGTFTVTLKRLQMRDTGWYWCSAGQQKKAVHVQVTPQPTTASVTPSQFVAHFPPPKPITKESWNSHGHILESLLVCCSIMVLVGLAILARKMWKLKRQDPLLRRIKKMKARHNEYSRDLGDLQDAAVIFHNKDSQEVQMH